MGENTNIQWCDHSFNLVWGCTKISPGCKNCYADTLARRYGHDVFGGKVERRTFGEKHWAEPLKWNSVGPAKVFCSSMCDIFEDNDVVAGQLAKLWPLIQQTPNLTWQLLTKRADRIANWLPLDWGNGYPNVWLGVSVENADYVGRVDELRKIPARVRFISYEPALGPIDGAVNLEGIHWLIYGGESGAAYRQDADSWCENIRDECARVGTVFFFKQRSAFKPGRGTMPDGTTPRAFPMLKGHCA